MSMTENEANIYSIAYRDCKEVADSIDVNEEYGKASTILFYMDEILEALKIASELQAIGTIEEFKALKDKLENAKEDIGKLLCSVKGYELASVKGYELAYMMAMKGERYVTGEKPNGNNN